uniref:Large polyvalent protein associated domain-containing protein n=1 Tax=viral metagenome TaxID=1070528 RepID=A0A6H1ZT64_9ZZZZ
METKTTPRFNYTPNAWEGSKYRDKQNLYGSSLSKEIRKELKETFPKCRFSVTSETYAGGQSINIALMKAPFKPFNEFNDEIAEKIENNVRRAFPCNWEEMKEQTIKNYIKYTTVKMYNDINQYHISDDFWMTDKAREVIIRALGIVQSFNFDDSDAQVDYFHTNFYLHASIGKWDKPFIQTK